MNYKIVLMSDVAESLLQAASTGTIHSVYGRTINLAVGGRLLSLQSAGSVLSPISLITDLSSDDMSSLWVQKGAAVRLGRACIELQNVKLSLADAQRRDLSCLGPLSNLDIELLHYNIKLSISHADTIGFDNIFIGNIQSAVLEYAHNYIRKCKIEFLAKNYSTAATALCRLVGLGQGLTPSGDDFLCGVLAGLTLTARASSPFAAKNYSTAATALCRLVGLGQGLTPSGDDFLCGVLAGLTLTARASSPFADQLRQTLQSRLADTNDISRAFLQCAIDNQYSQPVFELAEYQSHREILDSFKRIGHSSGIDTLCGILYALELYRAEQPQQ